MGILTQNDLLTADRSYTPADMLLLFQASKYEKYVIWTEYMARKPGLASLANPRGLFGVFLKDVYGKALILEELNDDGGYLVAKLASLRNVSDFLAKADILQSVLNNLNESIINAAPPRLSLRQPATRPEALRHLDPR